LTELLLWRGLLATCFMLVSCLAYSLNPEGGGNMFLHNIRQLSMDYIALYPRRQNASFYLNNLAMWSKMNFMPKFHHYRSCSCNMFDIVSIKSINDRTINECGTIREMRIGRRNQSTCRRRAPVQLCPPQKHDLIWDWIWAVMVGSHQQTTWLMASSLSSSTTRTTPPLQRYLKFIMPSTGQIITITYHVQLELLDHSLSCPPCSEQYIDISPHLLAAHQQSWDCHHPLHALCNHTNLIINRKGKLKNYLLPSSSTLSILHWLTDETLPIISFYPQSFLFELS
jgi:hypothetical protein